VCVCVPISLVACIISATSHVNTHTQTYTHTHNHFMALWTLSGTTQVSQYQKVHFAIFWIFWSKMKIKQADAPTIRMNCHPILTNWCPNLCHPHHFYARCPSWHNPSNLSWLGTGTKYAGLHTCWFGLYLVDLLSMHEQFTLCSLYKQRTSYRCFNHMNFANGWYPFTATKRIPASR